MEERVVYYSDKSSNCFGDLRLPAGGVTSGTPKALLIHGGGWSSMDRHSWRGVADFFHEMGFITYNIEYRLTPEAPWPACGDDCLDAAALLVNPSDIPEISVTCGGPIVICGGSAGGHLALMTGMRMKKEQVAGIVSISGIAEMEPALKTIPGCFKGLFKDGPIQEDAFPPAWLTPDCPPILLTHCYNDTVVPYESATQFAYKARKMGAPVQGYFYDMERYNQGHCVWIPGSAPHHLYPDLEDAIRQFLNRTLERPSFPANFCNGTFLGKLKYRHAKDVCTSPLSVGFECLDRELYEPELCYDALAAAGVKNARVQTGWSKCETQKGVYDFAWLDTIVDNLRARGIQPWFNVGFGNKLYMTDTYGEKAVGHVPLYYGDECLQAWKNFTRQLAEHFKDRITHYEIWNESNIQHFWRPTTPSAAEYARLIDITQEQIRLAQPDAKIGGCVSGYRHQFLDEFVRVEGILAKLDFFGLHSYMVLPDVNWREDVQYFRRSLDAFGGKHVSIWQGEGGFASWTPDKYHQTRFKKESQKAQAVWLLRRFVMDMDLGMELSSIFIVVDMMQRIYQMSMTTQDPMKVARQGLLNGLAYTPKMSYWAYANIASILQGTITSRSPGFEHNLTEAFPCTKRHDQLETTSLRKILLVRNGTTPLYFYYLPSDVQYDYPIIQGAQFSIFDEPDLEPLKEPVLVDLLHGDVYQLQAGRSTFCCSLKGMPVTDYPMLICDKSALEA